MYVASAKPQVFGDVSKDVDHLQCFTEPDASLHEQGFVFGGEFHEVRQGHFGPKHTHAARHAKGIVVQFVIGWEGRNGTAFVGGAEPLKVQKLTADDDLKAFEHAGLVIAVVRVEALDHQRYVSEKFSLVFIGLEIGQRREIRQVFRTPLDHLVVILKVVHQHVRIACFGIGDGVGHTGEEVEQADLASCFFGEVLERRIKRP